MPSFTSRLAATIVYREVNFTNTLDVYRSFYVNKYVDHHAFEIAF